MSGQRFRGFKDYTVPQGIINYKYLAIARCASAEFPFQNPPVPLAASASPFYEKHAHWCGWRDTYVADRAEPAEKTARSPVVLDLDDLSLVVASGMNGAGAIQATCVVVGGMLAFYGSKSALDQLIASSPRLKTFEAEQRFLIRELENGLCALTLPLDQTGPDLQRALLCIQHTVTDNLTAGLVQNQQNLLNEKVKFYFSGISALIGTAGMGIGDFCHPAVWSAFPSPAGMSSGAISNGILAGSVPFITLYGIGNALREIYNLRQTFQLSDVQLKAQSEADIYGLLQERLSHIRLLCSASSLSYSMMATGAPLTLGLGPLGLTALLPGVAGIMATSYLKEEWVKYKQHMSVEAIPGLGTLESLAAVIRYVDRDREEFEHHVNQKGVPKEHGLRDYMFRHNQLRYYCLEEYKQYLQADCRQIHTIVADGTQSGPGVLQALEWDYQKQIATIEVDQQRLAEDATILFTALSSHSFGASTFEVLIRFLKQQQLEQPVMAEALRFAPAAVRKKRQGKYGISYRAIQYYLEQPDARTPLVDRFLTRFFKRVAQTIHTHHLSRQEDLKRQLLDLYYFRLIVANSQVEG